MRNLLLYIYLSRNSSVSQQQQCSIHAAAAAADFIWHVTQNTKYALMHFTRWHGLYQCHIRMWHWYGSMSVTDMDAARHMYCPWLHTWMCVLF